MCDSDTSTGTLKSVRSTESGQFWKKGAKRKRRDDDTTSLSDADSPSTLDVAVGNRREEFLLVRKEKNAEAERRVEEKILKASAQRAALGLEVSDEVDVRSAHALNARVLEDVDIILSVATKSRNLKGTYVRALKDSASSIKMAVDALRKRSYTEETEKLQADNARLQKEVAELRREMSELREIVAQTQRGPLLASPRRPSPQRMEVPESVPVQGGELLEDLTRSIMLQVGSMVNARLEGIEERLLPATRLRPPLAADRRAAAQLTTVASQPDSGLEQAKNPKESNKKQKKGATSRSLPPAPQPMNEGWTTVVRRGAKKKASPKLTPATAVPAGSKKVASAVVGPRKVLPPGPRPVKLHPPRSSAVVITLLPGAEEKGITYAKVLTEAREKVDLAGCGIASLRYRKAATGARILVVPGMTSGDKADSLAKKLRDSMDAEVVKVSRPTKCADLRVSGLDDSVTVKEVVCAVAQRGCCPAESVKVGELRRDSRGTSSLWVSCPVSAAKKLAGGGRLLVGWVAASVKLLQPRTMRCFRCLQKGHVQNQCTSEVDRSDECYRCGEKGHKAAQCTKAAPRCSLCAAANKPADHLSGSKKCSPPKPKKGGTKAATKTSVANSSPPTQMGGEEAMVTS